MMLAEINEHEDSSLIRETWHRVKRGFNDNNLTSDQAGHLVNYAFYSLGFSNHRERGMELMREADSLPFDQISHYIPQATDQEYPSLKKPRNLSRDSSSSHRNTSRSRDRDGGHKYAYNRDRASKRKSSRDRRVSSRDRDNWHKDSNRDNNYNRSVGCPDRKISSANNNIENSIFSHREDEEELRYSSTPCNILVDHLRTNKGYYSAPLTKFWPRNVLTRIDTSIDNMQHGKDTCYLKDVYITPTNPTALIGNTPLLKLKPFSLLCGIFKVVKPEYRRQLAFMMRPQEAKSTIESILRGNNSWALSSYHSRCNQNALQLIRDTEGNWSVTQILLYKEPLFTPRKEPDNNPCFLNRTC